MSRASDRFSRIDLENVTDWYLIGKIKDHLETLVSDGLPAASIKSITVDSPDIIFSELLRRYKELYQLELCEKAEELEVTEEPMIEAPAVLSKEQVTADMINSMTKSRPKSYCHAVLSAILPALKALERDKPFDEYDPNEGCTHTLVAVSKHSMLEDIVLFSQKMMYSTVFVKAFHAESLESALELVDKLVNSPRTIQLSRTAGYLGEQVAYMVIDHSFGRHVLPGAIASIREKVLAEAIESFPLE